MFLDSTGQVTELLESNTSIAACIAPSFPAEFVEINDYRILVGMLRKLGFEFVVEVGFGADMVAKKYNELFENGNTKPVITSDCPAIVYYIEQYHPELVSHLAPITSPMVATGRIIRKKYGRKLKVVFIGPCIAKKAESDEIDEAITFRELRKLFEEYNIYPNDVSASAFDPPIAGKGSIFPVSRGLLQTVDKSDDICEGNIVVAEGKENFKEAIREFECGHLKDHHMELLSCEGCILGPGMTRQEEKYSGRLRISDYVKQKLDHGDNETWNKYLDEFQDLDYSAEFQPHDRRLPLPGDDEIEKVLHSMGKYKAEDHLNCGACGYETCSEHAVAIMEGLAEIEMCLPYTIEKLHHSIEELNESNEVLASTRQALRQSEKLAGMGQLSAGIAHELNNPLGVITMYSNILLEETAENSPIKKDLELIVEQTKRCKKIVGGLLNFARKNQLRKTEINLVKFCQKSLDSVICDKDIKINFNTNMLDHHAMIDTDQMMQVMTNLEKNAVEAMPGGGLLTVSLQDVEDEVKINISDTGGGINKKDMEKVFTPFFTTKGIGQGTGLGLPLVYGIVKMHKGQIKVESNADPEHGPTGTTFRITLPRK